MTIRTSEIERAAEDEKKERRHSSRLSYLRSGELPQPGRLLVTQSVSLRTAITAKGEHRSTESPRLVQRIERLAAQHRSHDR